jgi:peptidoglycan/xylan/chitin deacetylase (PgdA/CDA1 family)
VNGRPAVRGAGRLALDWLGRLAGTFDAGHRDVFAVLTYHRIAGADDPAPSSGTVSATPEAFARQVELLAAEFRPVSLGDLLDRAGGGPALPRRAVLVTFDDAYADFATTAWPILRAAGVPATLFVPTAAPDAGVPFWWDRLHHAVATTDRRDEWPSPAGRLPLASPEDRRHAFRRLRDHVKGLPHDTVEGCVDGIVADLGLPDEPDLPAVLGWTDLRRLAADGVELAAHSRHHPLLTRVRQDQLDDEIGGSVADLAERLGRAPAAAFAYPAGAYSGAVRAATARAGIRLGFTTERGLNDLRRADRLALRRINVGRRTDHTVLRAELHSRIGPAVAALAERRGRVGERSPAG